MNQNKWYWKGDSDWIEYSTQLCDILEKSYLAGEEKVSIDSEREVYLKEKEGFVQRRKDDPDRFREVKRITNTLTRYKWYWEGDTDWVEYSSQKSELLEKSFLAKVEKVSVDEEREVCFKEKEGFVQRRKDDPDRFRNVKREYLYPPLLKDHIVMLSLKKEGRGKSDINYEKVIDDLGGLYTKTITSGVTLWCCTDFMLDKLREKMVEFPHIPVVNVKYIMDLYESDHLLDFQLYLLNSITSSTSSTSVSVDEPPMKKLKLK